jgi:NhaA family Na+:H+ antiporter
MGRLQLHPHDHVLGSPETASVQVVMYGDYQCPYTRRGVVLLAELMDRMGEALLYTFRNFPLVDKHEHALVAALAAEAADRQDRFWDMHLELFRALRGLDEESLREHAEAIGLDVPRFVADFAAPATRARVKHDVDSGQKLGVDSTPTFFVDGELYNGPVEGISAVVEQAVADASAPGAH